jgi:hypothetical protein
MLICKQVSISHFSRKEARMVIVGKTNDVFWRAALALSLLAIAERALVGVRVHNQIVRLKSLLQPVTVVKQLFMISGGHQMI